MKRYEDCIRTDGACGACSISSHGLDCHNQQISNLLWHRSIAGLTQAELAERSGVNIRQIQRYESGSSDIGNMTLSNAKAIAEALEIDIEDLMEERTMTAEGLAKKIRMAETWGEVENEIKELCRMAGLEDEWENADGDTFETVIFEAASRLGVEVI